MMIVSFAGGVEDSREIKLNVTCTTRLHFAFGCAKGSNILDLEQTANDARSLTLHRI